MKLLALYDTMSQGQTAPINSNNIDTDANAKQIQKLCVQFFLEDKIVLMNADGEYEKHPGSEHFSQIIADWLNEYNKQAAVPRVLVGPVLAVSNQDNNNNANPQPQVMPPNQGSQDLRQLNESFKNQILVLKQQLHQREEEYQKLLSNYRAATLAIGENALLSTVVCDQLRLIFSSEKPE
ncbi:MAG: hypothetical protein HWD59_13905 [Coxiellaceae bacterium]|nr:MAG: hypothetical protein HWD59_13905 [Coxiellaceae bacterium]